MAALLTLPAARRVLALHDNSADRDLLLEACLVAVAEIVEERVGWVTEREVTVELRSGGPAVILPGTRVLGIASGEDIATGTAIDVTEMYISAGGILRRRDGGLLPASPWWATLQVGMNPIPDGVIRGAEEILRDNWKPYQGVAKKSESDERRTFVVSYQAEAWLRPHAEHLGYV